MIPPHKGLPHPGGPSRCSLWGTVGLGDKPEGSLRAGSCAGRIVAFVRWSRSPRPAVGGAGLAGLACEQPPRPPWALHCPGSHSHQPQPQPSPPPDNWMRHPLAPADRQPHPGQLAPRQCFPSQLLGCSRPGHGWAPVGARMLGPGAGLRSCWEAEPGLRRPSPRPGLPVRVPFYQEPQ